MNAMLNSILLQEQQDKGESAAAELVIHEPHWPDTKCEAQQHLLFGPVLHFKWVRTHCVLSQVLAWSISALASSMVLSLNL